MATISNMVNWNKMTDKDFREMYLRNVCTVIKKREGK